jgi:predicted Fe-S protein YdhL (DUF1289 family)
MTKWPIAVVVSSVAFFSTLALADDLYNEMNMKPLTPEQTAKLRSDRDAAKAKWASMTQAQKDEVIKSAKSKKISELNATELVGQNDDMTAETKKQTAQLKAEHEAAKAKWDKMTPDEKAAVRKSAQQKRLSELNTMERVGQNDDMGRYFSY